MKNKWTVNNNNRTRIAFKTYITLFAWTIGGQGGARVTESNL